MPYLIGPSGVLERCNASSEKPQRVTAKDLFVYALPPNARPGQMR